jgi:membrane protein YqaA with SNARE-associated domain
VSPGATLEPFATVAASPLILLILLTWGFGEALLLPIVPDVLIGILALAAPDQVWVLLAAAIAGGVVGSVAAWPLLLVRPRMMERLLIRLPGLGRRGLAEAGARIRTRGVVGAFAQVGPGLPLKAHLHALAAVSPDRSLGDVAALALLNRLARLAPIGLVFAALHPVAAGTGWPPELLAAVYLAGWSLFYAAYWRVRDPRRAR